MCRGTEAASTEHMRRKRPWNTDGRIAERNFHGSAGYLTVVTRKNVSLRANARPPVGMEREARHGSPIRGRRWRHRKKIDADVTAVSQWLCTLTRHGVDVPTSLWPSIQVITPLLAVCWLHWVAGNAILFAILKFASAFSTTSTSFIPRAWLYAPTIRRARLELKIRLLRKFNHFHACHSSDAASAGRKIRLVYAVSWWHVGKPWPTIWHRLALYLKFLSNRFLYCI